MVLYLIILLDVYVAQLTLNKETYADTGGSTLVAKVYFVNFPATEVIERSRFVKDEKIYVFEFKSGQSFHFSMTCEELVKKMKRVPLKIGVFRVDDNFPICYIFTHLSGCACDLGSLGIDNPVPYIFRGPFELVDPGNNFAGQLDLDITVSNLGRSLVTSYALAPNCFVFKNDLEGREFKCNSKEKTKLPGEIHIPFGDNLPNMGNRMMDYLLDTVSPGNLIRDIAGISPVADTLALGSPPPKPPRPPLVDPTLSTRRRRGRRSRRK